MRIVFLNVWEGKLCDAVVEFIKEQSVNTDIFCFQELSDDIREITKDILSDYEMIFFRKIIDENEHFSQATFVRKNIQIQSSGILLGEKAVCGAAIYVEIKYHNQPLYICNLHGTSNPGKKIDTPERLKQSRVPIDFFKEKEASVIIGGDFNLFSDTKSVQMFEKNGYKNLINDFNIQTTRNHYAWDLYPEPYYHSDYVFVRSDSLNIMGFSVPQNEVSDHLPLILEIE